MENPSSAFSFEEASQDIVSVNVTPSQTEYSSTYTYQPIIETERVKLIWGTTINIQEASDAFREFLVNFEQNEIKKYSNILDNVVQIEQSILKIDCQDLPEPLRQQLQNYPSEILPIFEQTLSETVIEKYPTFNRQIKIEPYNLGTLIRIRNVDISEIDRIVQIHGMVLRTSTVIPEILKASYECIKCKNEIKVECIKNILSEPTSCACGAKFSFAINHNEGLYMDKQIVKIQELPEYIPDGTAPMSITAIATEGLVDTLVPGNRVKITGVLKAVSVRLNVGSKRVKSIFRTFIEILSVGLIEKGSAVKKEGNLEEKLEELKKQDAYEILARSIAPSICGMEDVKKSILLQLCGGVDKELENSRLRGRINVLLAGDPGVAKSQLLDFVHRISDRGMYTSGRGSSAVGLTASVTRDVDTRQYVLESGALVLSDGGICCIDEFDKMNESTRSVLHEAMEQQTISVAKAGIITTLNARCSILASCNPVESKYNPKRTIVHNLNLPPTLLSRFDVIFLLIDKSDEEEDRRIGEHIVGMFGGREEIEAVEIDVLKKYVLEARALRPQLTPEAVEELKNSYCNLRQLNSGKTVTATTRQLESLIRLSEARARVRLSEWVEKADVGEAVRLVRESMLLYAVDPVTGKIDMDVVMSGKSASRRRRVDELKERIVNLLGKRMRREELNRNLKGEAYVEDAVRQLVEEGVVFEEKGFIEKVD